MFELQWSTVALAFLAGNVATVNPCGFAMLPAFASFIVGDVEDRAVEQAELPVRLWRAVRLGAAVSLAFVVVFGVTGLVFAYGSREVVSVVPWLAIGVGVLVTLYGIAVLVGRGGLSLRLPNPIEGRVNNRSALLFGVGYAIASLSCTLPVFLTVVASTLTTQGVAAGVAGFVAYGLGMGTVVFAVAIATALARDGLVRWLRRQGRHLRWVGGGVLTAVGLYLVVYWAWALGPGRSGSGDSPSIITTVTGWSEVATRFLDSTGGRAVVLALAGAVIAAIVIAVRGRHGIDTPDTSTNDQQPSTMAGTGSRS